MTSARESTAHLAELLRRERHEMAEFVIALSEFDRQRLWVELGYSGLFAFLHKELGLSKAAAYFRKAAADLVHRYPEVVPPFRDGRLCLTAVVELAKVITPENREDVLPRFFHCSKREAKAVSAALAPEEAPPMRAVVTAQVSSSSTGAVRPGELPKHVARSDETAPQSVRLDEPPSRGSVPALAAVPPPAPVKRDEVEPLTADLRRFHVTVSKRFLEKLEAARAALSHSHAGGSAEEILEAGLDLLLARAAKKRGIVEKPLTSRGRPRRATFPPTCAAPYRSATADAAAGRSSRVASAGRRSALSSTTSCRAPGAGHRRSRISGCCAGSTTTSRRGGRSETPAWTGSRGGQTRARTPPVTCCASARLECRQESVEARQLFPMALVRVNFVHSSHNNPVLVVVGDSTSLCDASQHCRLVRNSSLQTPAECGVELPIHRFAILGSQAFRPFQEVSGDLLQLADGGAFLDNALEVAERARAVGVHVFHRLEHSAAPRPKALHLSCSRGCSCTGPGRHLASLHVALHTVLERIRTPKRERGDPAEARSPRRMGATGIEPVTLPV